MKAKVVDLRYPMRDVVKALNRKSVKSHPLCGSLKARTDKSVEEIVGELRKGRFENC